jgi:hypothetical protein
MMRKIMFRAYGDCVGTDFYQLEEFPDDVTEKELDDTAEDLGRSWVDCFGPQTDLEDFESEEDYWQDYYEQCGWWWEDYNPDEHDGHF